MGFAQVGVGNTDPKATLDITASNVGSPSNEDGILIPRIANFPTSNPGADQDGMLVFYTGTALSGKGFYYWDDGLNSWTKVNNEIGWSIDGNSATDSSVDFIGTTDNESLTFRTNNIEKLRLTPQGQIEVLNTGLSVFLGQGAGANDDLTSNTNVFIGYNSGVFNTSGFSNNFIGYFSGRGNTIGDYNNFFGSQTGQNNTSGSQNNFYGYNSGFNTTTGNSNNFFGYQAGFANSIGSNNIGIGELTLRYNSTGSNNVAIGNYAGSGQSGNSKSGGVFIGNQAGRNENNDNRLYIDNSSTSFPLIYGEFDSNTLRINGELQINDPTNTGYVMPTTDGTNGQVMTSDGAGNITFQDVTGDGDTQNTLDQAYDEGGSGVGKDIIADNGAVTINGTDGILITGTLGSGNTIDDEITGDGIRMFFNPHKAAYRGGMAENDWWIDSRIGNYSFSHGRQTWVAGEYSVAFGRETSANGDHAFAGGFDSDAGGDRSFVYGLDSQSAGDYGIAFGNGAQANGDYSFAQGDSVLSNNDFSFTSGQYNYIYADHAKAIGQNLNAESYGEIVLGMYDTDYTENSSTTYDANDRLFVIGNGTSNSDRSNALTIYKSGLMNINDAYNMPETDGTAGQVMTTDGTGNVTFTDITAGDTDWVVQSTTNPATALTDNLFTDGTVKIGGTNAATGGAKLEVINANGSGGLAVVNTSTTGSNGIYNQNNVPNMDKILLRNFSNANNTGGTNSDLIGTINVLHNNVNNGIITGFKNDLNWNTVDANIFYGLFNETSPLANLDTTHGIYNLFRHSSITTYGLRNQHLTNGNSFYGVRNDANGTVAYGVYNDLSANTSYGSRSDISGSGSGNKYGYYVDISNIAGGDHYGIYSDVQKASGYAGYFIGRTSLGTDPGTGRYLMPETDGTNGQVMTTDGAGNVTFEDLPTFTDTDEQDLSSNVVTPNEEVEIAITNGTNTTINIQDADANSSNEIITAATLNGTNLEITEAGSLTTVDLSSLNDSGTDNQNIENLSLDGSNILTVGIENGSSDTVNLSSINTDEQDLGSSVITANEEVEISITNGTNTTINIQDADSNTSNELITSAILSGTDLEITEAGSTTAIDLSPLQDGIGAEIINDLTDARSDNDGTNNGSSIFLGVGSGVSDDLSHNKNVGIGYFSLGSNTTGENNTALGYSSLGNNTIGNGNFAGGYNALLDNTDGSNNIAIGNRSMENNISGSNNIAMGEFSLFQNTTGGSNIALGNQALFSNISAFQNTAIGSSVLRENTTGGSNVGIGNNALFENISGSNNVALGRWAGYSNTTGSGNITIGYRAGEFNTSSNRLYIDNSNTSIPLIYGEFDSNILRTNGTFQVGNPALTGYALPSADGTNGQVMTTDGSGAVTFQDLPVDTDNQQIDNFSFNNVTNILTLEVEDDGQVAQTVNLSSLNNSGSDNQQVDNFNFNSSTNILTLEIEDDGQAAQTVDLSSLNPQKAIARITMSTSQTETGGGTTKVNFDTRDFDVGGNFSLVNDNYVVPADGLYRVTVQITMAANTGTGSFGVRIRVGGTQQRRTEFNHRGSGTMVRQVTSILNLTAGDIIDVSFTRPVIGATILADSRVSFFEIEQL